VSRTSQIGAALVIGAGVLVGACGSPASRFYVIDDKALAAAPPAVTGFSGSVVVHAAAIPEVVDRPQMVITISDEQVVVLEQERWAESLRAGVPRYMAAQLSRLLGTTKVSTSEDVLADPDYRVILDVRRLDARPEVTVELEMLWRVRLVGGEMLIGHKRVREPIAGKGYDGISSATARALEAVARDIAQALMNAANTRKPPA
jgi:uncharacterized lipoprotein YmbA